MFERSQVFWKGLTRKQQTDPAAYSQAVSAFHQQLWSGGRREATTGWYGRAEVPGTYADIASDVAHRLQRVVDGTYEGGRHVPGRVRRVQQADMGYPTNRTTSFRLGEAAISFDRDTSTVRWTTGENNHAVDHAHEHPLAKAFFTALGEVRWTRGTGGHFTGNDEYNEESRDAGGGANYVTVGYGPLGAADDDAWQRTEAYTDSTGKQVRPEDFPGRKAFARQVQAYARASRGSGGVPGRQPRGVPVGGQFATRGRAETGTTLTGW